VFDDQCSSVVGGGLIAWVVHDVGVFGHFQTLAWANYLHWGSACPLS
jgi:hypothetical protein